MKARDELDMTPCEREAVMPTADIPTNTSVMQKVLLEVVDNEFTSPNARRKCKRHRTSLNKKLHDACCIRNVLQWIASVKDATELCEYSKYASYDVHPTLRCKSTS